MKKIALVLALIVPACSWFEHKATAVKDTAITCAKAEEAVATKGSDVITAAIEIAGRFALAVLQGNTSAILAGLFGQYGEPFVACVLHNIAPPSTGSGASTSEDDPVTAAARQVIETKGWTFK